jgi:hypothetical protein
MPKAHNDSPLPENCLRGVARRDWLLPGWESPDLQAFLPSEPDEDRGDDYLETSINWCDDVDGAKLNLQEKRDAAGLPHFKGGVVNIPRIELERIQKQYGGAQYFAFERRCVDENPFHGNLLFWRNLTKTQKFTMCGALSKVVTAKFEPE